MLETLDYTIRIGSIPTFLYFDLYLYSAYAAHIVYSSIFARANNRNPVFARANNQITAYSRGLSNSTIILDLIAFRNPEMLILIEKHDFLYPGRITRFQHFRQGQ